MQYIYGDSDMKVKNVEEIIEPLSHDLQISLIKDMNFNLLK